MVPKWNKSIDEYTTIVNGRMNSMKPQLHKTVNGDAKETNEHFWSHILKCYIYY